MSKFEELARKAGMVEVKYHPGFPDIVYPPNYETFARSIVDACLEQCVDVSREYPQGGPWTPDGPDPANHAAYMASVKCRVKIKEHFGIE